MLLIVVGPDDRVPWLNLLFPGRVLRGRIWREIRYWLDHEFDMTLESGFWLYVQSRQKIYGPFVDDSSKIIGSIDGLDAEQVRYSLSITKNFQSGTPLVPQIDSFMRNSFIFNNIIIGIYKLTKADESFLEQPSLFSARAFLGNLLAGMEYDAIELIRDFIAISNMSTINGNLQKSYLELWKFIKDDLIRPAEEDFRIPGMVSEIIGRGRILNLSVESLQFIDTNDNNQDNSISMNQLMYNSKEYLSNLDISVIRDSDEAMNDQVGFELHAKQEYWRHPWPHQSL